jgi:glycosyltransferase involved in cell wall biosynthesis
MFLIISSIWGLALLFLVMQAMYERRESERLPLISETEFVPWWSIRSLFFVSSYVAIYKRYVLLAWAYEANSVKSAVVMALLLNMVMCLGVTVSGYLFDSVRNHKWTAISLMTVSTGFCLTALVLSYDVKISDPVLVVCVLAAVITSIGCPSFRDLVVTKQVMEFQSKGVDAHSFGENRKYTVLGQAFLALLTSYAMAAQGSTVIFPILTGLLVVSTLLYSTTFPTRVVDRLISCDPGRHEPRQAVLNSGAWTFEVCCLFTAALFLGVASTLFEVILYVYLQEIGVPMHILGIAHSVALVSELPVFHYEHRLVKLLRGYENLFVFGAMATATRLALLAYVVWSPTSVPYWPIVVIEASHGLSRATGACSIVRLAAVYAPPGCETFVQSVLNTASGFGGYVLGCMIFGYAWTFGAHSNFLLGSFLALASAAVMLWFQTMQPEIQTPTAKPVDVIVRRLVIVVRADPVICGHATEARNLAEAAASQGTEVHIVTWPMEALQKGGLPLKPVEDAYGPRIHVHRPPALGDEKILDGRYLLAMSARIVDILQAEDKYPMHRATPGAEEVDVVNCFYLLPHMQVVLPSVTALSDPDMRLRRRVVSIAKAVGSDITSQVARCLEEDELGGAVLIFDAFLAHDVLHAVSGYTKTIILESARHVDKRRGTQYEQRLKVALKISYPPIDTKLYLDMARQNPTGQKACAPTPALEACARYNVDFGTFVLFLSRVTKAKGVHDLILAYGKSSLPDAGWPLLICGTGADFESSRALADAQGRGELIRFTGSIPDEDKGALLHACGAYCLPSKPTPNFIETFGIALAEKMLAGGPGVTITTTTGGIPEATDGHCIEVEVGDIESIKEGLEVAKAMPEDARSKLTIAARLHAEKFDRTAIWNAVKDDVLSFVGDAQRVSEHNYSDILSTRMTPHSTPKSMRRGCMSK